MQNSGDAAAFCRKMMQSVQGTLGQMWKCLLFCGRRHGGLREQYIAKILMLYVIKLKFKP